MRRPLEALDQDDVGAGEVARARGRSGSYVVGRALEEHAHVRGSPAARARRGPRGSGASCRCPGWSTSGGMVGVLDGHDPLAAAHELARERDGQRGLSGVLPPDDGDDSRRRHSSSARARSSAVFTLKNSERPGRRSGATSARGRIPTPMRAWKPMARRSPCVEARCDGGAAGGAVRGAERLDAPAARRSRGGRRRRSRGPRPARRSSAAETKGMSQATHDHRGRRLAPPRCRSRPATPRPGRTSATTREVRAASRRPPGRWRRGAAACRGPRSCVRTSRSRIRAPPTDLEALRPARRSGWRRRRRGWRPRTRRSVAPPPASARGSRRCR